MLSQGLIEGANVEGFFLLWVSTKRTLSTLCEVRSIIWRGRVSAGMPSFIFHLPSTCTTTPSTSLLFWWDFFFLHFLLKQPNWFELHSCAACSRQLYPAGFLPARLRPSCALLLVVVQVQLGQSSQRLQLLLQRHDLQADEAGHQQEQRHPGSTQRPPRLCDAHVSASLLTLRYLESRTTHSSLTKTKKKTPGDVKTPSSPDQSGVPARHFVQMLSRTLWLFLNPQKIPGKSTNQ